MFLKYSIAKHLSASFFYKNKAREVNPYRLLHNNGIWYLLATQEGTLKYFTLAKIVLIKDYKPKCFTPDEKIISLINQDNMIWVSQKPIQAKLLIQNEIKEYLLRKEFLPKFKILHQNKSNFLIECAFGYEFEILKLAKTFLPFIRILSPKNLQAKLDNELQDYLKQTKNKNFEISQEIFKRFLE